MNASEIGGFVMIDLNHLEKYTENNRIEAKKALEAAIEQSEALEADEDIDDVVDEELEVSETEEV